MSKTKKAPIAPPQAAPVFPPQLNRLALSLTLILIAGLYFKTLPPGLTWANSGADGGDLISAAATLGIAHPTGYPTYLLLAKFFQTLFPLGDLAYRTAAFSSVVTLGAVVALYYALLQAEAAPTLAWAAATTVGLGQLVWSQAIIAEVHGLNAFFVVLALWGALNLLNFERRLTWGDALLALSLSLGLGNHVTLVFMVAAWGLAGLWRLYHRRDEWRMLLGLGGLSVAGLVVYLYLPLRAQTAPPINWGNPVDWPGFVWLVSGEAYRGYAFGLPETQFAQRLAAWASQMRDQFGLLAITLGFFGLFFGETRRPALRWVSLWALVIYSGFAIAYNTPDSFAYLIPAMIGFAALIGLGLQRLADWAAPRHRFARLAVLGAFALMVLARLPTTYAAVDASQNTEALQFTQTVITQAPPEAIVLTTGDRDSFALWYIVFAARARADLSPIVLTLLNFPWYRQDIHQRYPRLTIPNPYTVEAFRLANPNQPICETPYPDPESVLPIFKCD